MMSMLVISKSFWASSLTIFYYYLPVFFLFYFFYTTLENVMWCKQHAEHDTENDI